jgi:hypothetical protein
MEKPFGEQLIFCPVWHFQRFEFTSSRSNFSPLAPVEKFAGGMLRFHERAARVSRGWGVFTMGLLKVGNQYLHLARYLFDTCSQQRQQKTCFFSSAQKLLSKALLLLLERARHCA